MLPLILIAAIAACIIGPILVAYAIKYRRQKRADLDDADPDFCGWYDDSGASFGPGSTRFAPGTGCAVSASGNDPSRGGDCRALNNGD